MSIGCPGAPRGVQNSSPNHIKNHCVEKALKGPNSTLECTMLPGLCKESSCALGQPGSVCLFYICESLLCPPSRLF
nr:hypothetical transcript [Hymenolepis microstoma]